MATLLKSLLAIVMALTASGTPDRQLSNFLWICLCLWAFGIGLKARVTE